MATSSDEGKTVNARAECVQLVPGTSQKVRLECAPPAEEIGKLVATDNGIRAQPGMRLGLDTILQGQQ